MHFSFSRNGGKVFFFFFFFFFFFYSLCFFFYFFFFKERRESFFFFFFFFCNTQTRCEIWKISFLKYVMRYANQDHFADISEGKKT